MENERKFPFNSRLHNAREGCGWSQVDLAKLVGTTPVNISRWENGSTFPTPFFRQRIRKVFGKTLAELGLVPPVNPSSKTGNIPIARNPFFIGRDPLLVLIHKRLSITRMAALTQAQALYGLGGIGKTQTAAEYAFRYGEEYAHVFWVRAANHDTLVADFVKLANLLNLPEKDELDQPLMLAAVKGWLADNEDWLLILDNADDLLLAKEFLPTSHKGYILFTTRAQAVGTIAASIEVEQLALQEGILLLLRWSKRLPIDAPLDRAQAADLVAAEGIVREMDGLPLALVQAAAYVEETGCSLEDYLRLYATLRKELLARRSRFLTDYPDTVATTWSLSFLQVEQESPTAANLLRLCAFLSPDAIPEELLTHGTAELDTSEGDKALASYKLNEALEVLRRYSLVRRSGDSHLLSIHRLVQAVLKDSMDQQIQRIWAERTVRTVNAIFPDADDSADEKQQYYLQYYAPHVQECALLIEKHHLHFQEAARLLHQAGASLHFHGSYQEAQSLYRQALAVRERVFGPEHSTVAESLNSLALLARFQGDFEQAEKFHKQALAIRQKTLGPTHAITGQSLNNLGVLYRNQGKYEQAEPLLHQAVIIYEQSLGPEHPDTLLILINLAKLYIEQKNYERAEPLAKRVLTTSERVLEPEHHIIARSLNLMARLSFEQRNYEQAETLWKWALAITEKMFGPEHPSVAEQLDNLAELYSMQGRFTLAESLCRRALHICEHTLGVEHPDTITYRHHLSQIVSKKEAEQGDDFSPPAQTGR